MLNRLKYIATAGALAASVFSSVGVASAATYVAGRVAAPYYTAPYYPYTPYVAGAGGYYYNNGYNAGAGHVVATPRGYTAGTTNCTSGYGCTHYGAGAGVYGGKYNNYSYVVRNGNGTCTVYSVTNYMAPGTTYWQTSTTSKVIYC